MKCGFMSFNKIKIKHIHMKNIIFSSNEAAGEAFIYEKFSTISVIVQSFRIIETNKEGFIYIYIISKNKIGSNTIFQYF